MIVATLVLLLSASMCCFYFQVTCQKVLRRKFERDYFQSIATANQLEFLSLRESLNVFASPAAYSRLQRVLRCDFLALTYLLKNAANVNQRYANEERLLILYFHWQLFLLAVRRVLRMGEDQAILKLALVLEYFANVIGRRIEALRFGNLAAAGYF